MTQKAVSTPSERLYIGNFGPEMDEYTLTQLCRKHGKIVSFDFPFHRHGPLKGEPRGFAFVQYETTTQALKAILELHDKTIRGRRLIVSPANEASDNPRAASKKTGQQSNVEKIEALERKLKSMEAESIAPPSAESSRTLR